MKKQVEIEDDIAMPRKVNDVMAAAAKAGPARALFDRFWQMGEMLLLFGAAGVGKSLMAVRLADALARGRPIAGFDMPKRRHRVLYVDLTLSEAQFQRRYTPELQGAKPYRFAERFSYERPGHDEDLCTWVRKMVRKYAFEVIIIDDLSAVMRTNDGTFDSLRIVRDLKRLSHETGVAIMVLADSMPSRRQDLSEADLRRSSILCGVADSVLGLGSYGHGHMKLVHFRSHGVVKWGNLNPIGCAIVRNKHGVPDFVFDERFAPRLKFERCALICEVNKLVGDGLTFREIAEKMGFSKSRAARLFHAWTPAVHKLIYGTECHSDEERYRLDPEEFEDEEYEDDEKISDENDQTRQEFDKERSDDKYDLADEYGEDESEYYDEDDPDDRGYEYEMIADIESESAKGGSARRRTVENASVLPSDSARFAPPGLDAHRSPRINPKTIPFAAALGHRSILDLEREVDGYGREIFVESRNEYNRKPFIWYKQNDQRHFNRYERKLTTILCTNIGRSGFVP